MKFREFVIFLELQLRMLALSLIWAALPGAQNPDGSSPPRTADAYDSESLSALKSNIGDREIVFFSVTDYFRVLHPSIGKISRLTLQNSLRMFPDLKKDYSFTLVVSNPKIYSSGKSYQ